LDPDSWFVKPMECNVKVARWQGPFFIWRRYILSNDTPKNYVQREDYQHDNTLLNNTQHGHTQCNSILKMTAQQNAVAYFISFWYCTVLPSVVLPNVVGPLSIHVVLFVLTTKVWEKWSWPQKPYNT
jgi:hypothetical protein